MKQIEQIVWILISLTLIMQRISQANGFKYFLKWCSIYYYWLTHIFLCCTMMFPDMLNGSQLLENLTADGKCIVRRTRGPRAVRYYKDENGVKFYMCEYCDYKCRSPGNLAKHVRRHTGELSIQLWWPRNNEPNSFGTRLLLKLIILSIVQNCWHHTYWF